MNNENINSVQNFAKACLKFQNYYQHQGENKPLKKTTRLRLDKEQTLAYFKVNKYEKLQEAYKYCKNNDLLSEFSEVLYWLCDNFKQEKKNYEQDPAWQILKKLHQLSLAYHESVLTSPEVKNLFDQKITFLLAFPRLPKELQKLTLKALESSNLAEYWDLVENAKIAGSSLLSEFQTMALTLYQRAAIIAYGQNREDIAKELLEKKLKDFETYASQYADYFLILAENNNLIYLNILLDAVVLEDFTQDNLKKLTEVQKSIAKKIQDSSTFEINPTCNTTTIAVFHKLETLIHTLETTPQQKTNDNNINNISKLYNQVQLLQEINNQQPIAPSEKVVLQNILSQQQDQGGRQGWQIVWDGWRPVGFTHHTNERNTNERNYLGSQAQQKNQALAVANRLYQHYQSALDNQDSIIEEMQQFAAEKINEWQKKTKKPLTGYEALTDPQDPQAREYQLSNRDWEFDQHSRAFTDENHEELLAFYYFAALRALFADPKSNNAQFGGSDFLSGSVTYGEYGERSCVVKELIVLFWAAAKDGGGDDEKIKILQLIGAERRSHNEDYKIDDMDHPSCSAGIGGATIKNLGTKNPNLYPHLAEKKRFTTEIDQKVNNYVETNLLVKTSASVIDKMDYNTANNLLSTFSDMIILIYDYNKVNQDEALNLFIDQISKQNIDAYYDDALQSCFGIKCQELYKNKVVLDFYEQDIVDSLKQEMIERLKAAANSFKNKNEFQNAQGNLCKTTQILQNLLLAQIIKHYPINQPSLEDQEKFVKELIENHSFNFQLIYEELKKNQADKFKFFCQKYKTRLRNINNLLSEKFPIDILVKTKFSEHIQQANLNDQKSYDQLLEKINTSKERYDQLVQLLNQIDDPQNRKPKLNHRADRMRQYYTDLINSTDLSNKEDFDKLYQQILFSKLLVDAFLAYEASRGANKVNSTYARYVFGGFNVKLTVLEQEKQLNTHNFEYFCALVQQQTKRFKIGRLHKDSWGTFVLKNAKNNDQLVIDKSLEENFQAVKQCSLETQTGLFKHNKFKKVSQNFICNNSSSINQNDINAVNQALRRPLVQH